MGVELKLRAHDELDSQPVDHTRIHDENSLELDVRVHNCRVLGAQHHGRFVCLRQHRCCALFVVGKANSQVERGRSILRLADGQVAVKLHTDLLGHVEADDIASGVNLEEIVQLLAWDDISQERDLDHEDAGIGVGLRQVGQDLDVLSMRRQIDSLGQHVLKDLHHAFSVSLNLLNHAALNF